MKNEMGEIASSPGLVEEPFRIFVETMQKAAVVVDANGQIVYASAALAELIGLRSEKLVQLAAELLVARGDRGNLVGLLRMGLARTDQRELRLLTAPGATIPALFIVTPLHGGAGPAQVGVVIRDLRERDEGRKVSDRLDDSERSRRALLSALEDQAAAQQRLARVNRALKTLSAGNAALVHAKGERELLAQMLRVICETGGYPISYIGYPVDDAARSIVWQSFHGFDPTAVLPAPTWADNEYGQHVVGRAIRSGQTQLIRDASNDPAYGPWREKLGALGVHTVLALPLASMPEAPPFGALLIATHGTDMHPEEVALLEELAANLAYGISSLRSRAEQQQGAEHLQRSLEQTVHALAGTVETRDPYTAGHQQRVALIAIELAGILGLPDVRVRGLSLAATIHDIGKLSTPAEILSKPGRLTPLEFELVKTHAEAGYQIIKGVEFPWPVAEMVRQHHERLDGSGYPRGLKGDEILLEARILAVADVVEAMFSHRPYRPGLGIEAALAEIVSGRGKGYDPDVVDACVTLFRERNYQMPT